MNVKQHPAAITNNSLDYEMLEYFCEFSLAKIIHFCFCFRTFNSNTSWPKHWELISGIKNHNDLFIYFVFPLFEIYFTHLYHIVSKPNKSFQRCKYIHTIFWNNLSTTINSKNERREKKNTSAFDKNMRHSFLLFFFSSSYKYVYIFS